MVDECSSCHQNRKCSNFTLFFFAEDGIQLFLLSACILLIIPKSTSKILNLRRCRQRPIPVVDA